MSSLPEREVVCWNCISQPETLTHAVGSHVRGEFSTTAK